MPRKIDVDIFATKIMELWDQAETEGRNDIIDMTGLVSLGVAERKDRIYAMTVKVYEAGADITAATPLVSLTGTKLE